MIALLPVLVAALILWTGISDRVVKSADPPSDRLQAPARIAPGAPPILSFRLFDAADRGRLAAAGLMTDDAGH